MARWAIFLVGLSSGILVGLALAAALTKSPHELVASSEAQLAAVTAERDRAVMSLNEESAKLRVVTAERDSARASVTEVREKRASLADEIENARGQATASPSEPSAKSAASAGRTMGNVTSIESRLRKLDWTNR